MDITKLKSMLKGVLKSIPVTRGVFTTNTSGTNEARYCYSVWMRHLVISHTTIGGIPQRVAELGPGDSLGIGLAALLSGVSCVYAFDIVNYPSTEKNLLIFDELVSLFRNRSAIPSIDEYPNIKPSIDSCNFPSGILSNEELEQNLATERINAIRRELANINDSSNIFIQYQVPWMHSDILQKDSVDFIYSQAVLEHVDDLPYTYQVMSDWLKPGGYMSHTIDFKSHGLSAYWNGQWTFNRFEWALAKAGRPYLLNRKPCSFHVHLHEQNGFNIKTKRPVKQKNMLSRQKLIKAYRGLSEEDITTSGVYILSQKLS